MHPWIDRATYYVKRVCFALLSKRVRVFVCVHRMRVCMCVRVVSFRSLLVVVWSTSWLQSNVWITIPRIVHPNDHPPALPLLLLLFLSLPPPSSHFFYHLFFFSNFTTSTISSYRISMYYYVPYVLYTILITRAFIYVILTLFSIISCEWWKIKYKLKEKK